MYQIEKSDVDRFTVLLRETRELSDWDNYYDNLFEQMSKTEFIIQHWWADKIDLIGKDVNILNSGVGFYSVPMCFEKGELMLDNSDVWLGNIHGCNFYMSKDQFEYWQHTQLTVNITKGRGASFSLEIPLGLRFIIESRLFTDEEIAALEPIRYGEQQ